MEVSLFQLQYILCQIQIWVVKNLCLTSFYSPTGLVLLQNPMGFLDYFMKLNNSIQRRRDDKTSKIGYPFRLFSKKNKDCSLISCQNNQCVGITFYAFEQHSGLRKFAIHKIATFKIFKNFKVIGSEEMPILVWGRCKSPPNKLRLT